MIPSFNVKLRGNTVPVKGLEGSEVEDVDDGHSLGERHGVAITINVDLLLGKVKLHSPSFRRLL